LAQTLEPDLVTHDQLAEGAVNGAEKRLAILLARYIVGLFTGPLQALVEPGVVARRPAIVTDQIGLHGFLLDVVAVEARRADSSALF